ncbi:MAG: hypothetical protein AAF224_09465 [Pseudomonadota bacterium]
MAIDGNKLRARDDANISFDRGNFEKAHDARNAERAPKAPQPSLTPSGTLRREVDASVQEKADAIKAKLRADRERTQTRER